MPLTYIGESAVEALLNNISTFTKTRQLREGDKHLSSVYINNTVARFIGNAPEPLNLGLFNTPNELFTMYPNGSTAINAGKYAWVKNNNSYIKYSWKYSTRLWEGGSNSVELSVNQLISTYSNANGVKLMNNAHYNTIMSLYHNNLGRFKIDPACDFIITDGGNNIIHNITQNTTLAITFNNAKYANTVLVVDNGNVVKMNYYNMNVQIIQPVNPNVLYVKCRQNGTQTVNNFKFVASDSANVATSKMLTFTESITQL